MNISYDAGIDFRSFRTSIFGGLIAIQDHTGRTIDCLDLEVVNGPERINVILNWYRKWCWANNHYQQWLPPNDIKELGKLWSEFTVTSVEGEVYDALEKGVKRYEQAQDTWVKVLENSDPFSIKSKEYFLIYVHREEPRFCALRKSSIWKKIEEYLSFCSVAEHARFLQYLIRDGIVATLPLLLVHWKDDTDFRKEKGLKIKTGKIVSMFYSLDEHEIEVLSGYVTDVLREGIATTEDVEVCDTPSDIYSLEHHSGIGSCMKELGSDRFELYDILKCCSIAYIVNSEDIVQARALLWNDVVGFSKTTRIMDTIYAKDSDTVAVMKKWAVENGYWYKTSQAHACREFTNGEEKATIPNDARVYFPDGWSIYRGMFAECPYVDTFKTYDYGRNFLKVGGGRYDLSSTEGDGDIMTENICCCKCYDDLQEEEPWQDGDDNYYCESCRDENFSKCDCCGDWFKVENTRYVEDTYETFCEDCYDERYFWCSYCETDHPIDEMINIKVYEDGEFKCFVNCCQDEADEYYPDRKQCPICGYFESESNLIEIDGQEMCQDCVSTRTIKCDSCGERHLKRNLENIFVARKGEIRKMWILTCKECTENQTGAIYKCDDCGVWCWKDHFPPVNLGYEQICSKCYKSRLNEEEKAA